MKVEKWRNIGGVQTQVGTMYRDIQIQTLVCNNQLPVLSGIDTTMTKGYDPNDTIFMLEFCVGDTVEFTIWGYDADTYNPVWGERHIFSISWNNGIPQGTFHPMYNNTDSARASFTWVPGLNDVSNIPYCFTATIADGACPLNGVQVYAYCVLVKGFQMSAGSDTLLCQGESVSFQATSTVPVDMYQWFVNGVLTGPLSNESEFVFHSSNHAPGTYIIAVESPNHATPQCPGKGDAVVEVVYQLTPNLGGNQTLYDPNPVVLDAGPGTLYHWTTGETTQTITVFVSDLYGVEVDGSNGTRCTGSDQVYIEYLIGIEEETKTHTMEISPNPTAGQLHISFGDNIATRISGALYTPEGKKVHAFTAADDAIQNRLITLEIGHLANGLYILRVETPHGSVSQKVVLQK